MYAGIMWKREKIRDLVSLLWWPDELVARMKKSGKWKGTRGCEDGISYKTDMVAYLFELTYDLLLDSGECVSLGPGFEGPLGWHCV